MMGKSGPNTEFVAAHTLLRHVTALLDGRAWAEIRLDDEYAGYEGYGFYGLHLRS